LSEFKETLHKINKFYDVYNNRIFAFSNVNNPKEVYITYNVLNMKKESPKFPNTILIHRKKQTNTLYTLNSMNKLIEEEHGSIDHNYVIDWTLYSNSLIITGDVSIRIIPLKILSITE
jgi:hypothetical protein